MKTIETDSLPAHESHTKQLELFNHEDTPIEYNIYSDFGRFEGKFLNTSYDRDLRRLDFEIYFKELLNADDDARQDEGVVAFQVFDTDGDLLTEKIESIDDAPNAIIVEHAFVPYWIVDKDVDATDIERVDFYILRESTVSDLKS